MVWLRHRVFLVVAATLICFLCLLNMNTCEKCALLGDTLLMQMTVLWFGILMKWLVLTLIISSEWPVELTTWLDSCTVVGLFYREIVVSRVISGRVSVRIGCSRRCLATFEVVTIVTLSLWRRCLQVSRTLRNSVSGRTSGSELIECSVIRENSSRVGTMLCVMWLRASASVVFSTISSSIAVIVLKVLVSLCNRQWLTRCRRLALGRDWVVVGVCWW